MGKTEVLFFSLLFDTLIGKALLSVLFTAEIPHIWCIFPLKTELFDFFFCTPSEGTLTEYDFF